MNTSFQIQASFEQERAWTLDCLTRGNPAQNFYKAFRISGALDQKDLGQALIKLTQRHEILRTSLAITGESLNQIVHSSIDASFTFCELWAGTVNQPDYMQRLATRFIERPFHLNTAPLWRVLLAKLQPTEHILILSMHSAVCDGSATLDLFVQELLHLYRIQKDQIAENTLPAPAQYRDHVTWQRGLAHEAEAAQDYWRQYLAGELESTTLPMCRTRPPVQTFNGACYRQIIPPGLAEQIQRFSSRQGLSPSAFMMAALVSLLHRYTSKVQITLGHSTSTRRQEHALGNFTNLAVMRIDLSEHNTFEKVLQATRESIAKTDEHKHYPFQHLVHCLGVPRDPSTTPLFQILFESDLEAPPPVKHPFPEEHLNVDDFEIHSNYAAYDLHVTAGHFRGDTIIDWRFNTELFSKDSIVQFGTHLSTLISSAAETPWLPVANLALLSNADKKTIMQHWNAARMQYRKACIQTLVEEQVAQNPHAIALEFHASRLTYDELNRKANQLAHHLISKGAGTGEMIGICMDRSIEMMVAILAVFKAGAVVVPLDSSYPPERLGFMLGDAAVRIVLTTRNLLERSPSLTKLFSGLTLLLVDDEHSAISRASENNPLNRSTPQDVAYCIYTSGSTGDPKGVIVEHSSLSNLVAWHCDNWLVDAGTRTLLYSPISFDVAFHEIAVGLCSGATLVQLDEETRCNPIGLLDFVREQKIEKWYMPFVTLQQIAQAATTADAPTDLKELIVGGEPLRITSEIREFARRTGCVIHNHYGSTECLDIATHTLSGSPDTWPSLVPIGRANVHNTNAYILDSLLQLVPIGVIGEIYGDGDCLARGYHARPDLTAERFIPNPFGVQGDRLYKTGDLGRYLPDGTIECIGRADRQVKIRGFRVELGEIESKLAAHALVAECAVTFNRTANGSPRLAAYVVPKPGKDTTQLSDTLRMYMREMLPEYMIPTAVVKLKALPLTPSGKVNVRKLPDCDSVVAESKEPTAGNSLEADISGVWRELLKLPHIDIEKSFFELGGDSLLLVRAHQKIAELLSVDLPPLALFKYPSVKTLTHFLANAKQHESRAETQYVSTPIRPRREIAIIGMSTRVPGAKNISEFWSNLRNGIESIEELAEPAIFKTDGSSEPGFVRAAATLPDVDLFDASFFEYSPAEAEVIDPQQRIFLECAWEALENAGIDPEKFSGSIGVYAGASLSTYLINNVLPAKSHSKTFLSHRLVNEATELRIEQGNARDHLPMRISYKLNLRGPSINVQSTCSTSLVAVHLACKALLNEECDVALAGGVSVIVPQNTGYLCRDGMMLSPDGHCRAFDAKANGTVFGNGLGVVVLKPLHLAVEQKDHIYAVIKGSAVNNDGSVKLDYAAPSVEAQADVIAKAHAIAGISAAEISYVEAHGTGTLLGDPIEIAALTEAFRRTSNRRGQYCSIGSVKTNIGHLDEAAGVVALIKTALALYYKELPPSLHFCETNPRIDFKSSPFVVNAALSDWKHEEGVPRRAGVSSFAMGGTNCHVVLEEPPILNKPAAVRDRSVHVLPISAKSRAALRQNVERYIKHLDCHSSESFADTCFSAATGRRHFKHRIAVVTDTAKSARAQLSRILSSQNLEQAGSVPDQPLKIAFMFTGQGSQYPQMGRFLYDTQPTFRSAIEECDSVAAPLIGRSLSSVLYQTTDRLIDETAIAQPALFAVEYALYKLWNSWGVTPTVLVGHSIGEYVAACAAGIFTLEDGLKLVIERGRLMQSLPRLGCMAQVNANVDEVTACLRPFHGAVSIAAINGPHCTVISGQTDAVSSVCDQLRKAHHESVLLNVSHAFHSPLMEPMLGQFEMFARSLNYSLARLDIVSNITGEIDRENEMANAGYWVRQVEQPVQFQKGLLSIKELGVSCFLELGPKPTLIQFGRLCLPEAGNIWLPSITPRNENAIVSSFKELYLAGVPVDWVEFEKPFKRSRIPLPSYAFQRQRYWLDPDREKSDFNGVKSREQNVYRVEWKPLSISLNASSHSNWIIIRDSDEFANRVTAHLRAQGATCTEVFLDHHSELAVDRDQFSRAAQAMADLYKADNPVQVLYLPGSSSFDNVPQNALDTFIAARNLLMAALASSNPKNIWFVTRESQFADNLSETGLSQSVLVGLAHVVNVEHPELSCVCLDLPAEVLTEDLEVLTRLVRLREHNDEEQLAIRNGQVYVPRLTRHDVYGRKGLREFPIRPSGVYLITGGTSGLGLQLALRIARQKPRRLCLVSRSGTVAEYDRTTWEQILSSGTRVDILKADISDESQVKHLLEHELQNEVTGIFHCAGSLDDGILINQTTERCARVMSPKVQGAWLLHQLTLARDVEFFVMFSSTASLIGYGGQASYSAANAFLDTLAHYRTSRGLPALSVSWGGWAGTGMTGRLSAVRPVHGSKTTETLIDVESGMDILATLVQSGLPHAAVASIDWNDFAASRTRVPSIITSLIDDDPQTQKNQLSTVLQKSSPDRVRQTLETFIADVIRDVLGRDSSFRIDPKMGFQEMGLDSLGAIDVRSRLQSELGRNLPATLVFDHPCLENLTAHLKENYFSHLKENYFREDIRPAIDDKPDAPVSRQLSEQPIAIIGMGCRFPNAKTPDEFWQLLVAGCDTTRPIPPERWNVDEFYDADADAPGKMYVTRAALIDDADCFDPAFFGISPREAISMDPRHRLLLEVTWEALEAAGIDPSSLRESDTGVYLGGDEFINGYVCDATQALGTDPYLITGNTLSFAAGRLSYKLGLHGPSMAIATACSSSLVALHTAVQAIRRNECGMAIVGSAKIIFGADETIQLCKLKALAPDGRSKVFSAAADGYGRGEGCGVILLKKLDQAVADGDPVLAIIRGTAVNHDGPSAGLTVPNGKSQSRLITAALKDAGVNSSDVTYVEAHGTGTQLGDPIEINALSEVFTNGRLKPLLVGSVKANIGHLEEAAGIAGLMKVVLSFQHDQIPPQIHCEVLNEKIPWNDLPLIIPKQGVEWPPDTPKIAGVSSFGMSGTNAHVVLESFASASAPRQCSHSQHIFTFSAHDQERLRECVLQFVKLVRLNEHPCDIAYTLHTGRRHERQRLAVVAENMVVLRQRLEQYVNGQGDIPGVHIAALSHSGDIHEWATAETGRTVLQSLISNEDWGGLAKLWCTGFAVDWKSLYKDSRPRRVTLPTYPFRRERLWIGGNGRVAGDGRVTVTPPVDPPRDVLSSVRQFMAELLGMKPDDLEIDVPLDALGADSLIFLRTSQFVYDNFQVRTSFQQLIEQTSTVRKLADFVGEQINGRAIAQTDVPAYRETSSSERATLTTVQAAEDLSTRQAQFLKELTQQYSERTRTSKDQAERDRPFMANCRMSPFQAHTKEMSYPIVAQRSSGSRIWDIDGNEYIDISMGYGVHLFGHQPSFVTDAMREQLEQGMHIGPQSDRAGRVAQLICELTGLPRVAFCNSGTEAVMGAIRFARAATGRTKFVMFEGSYHGWSDGTLALPAGTRDSIPMTRGIGAGAMNDVVVVEYGTRASLKIIESIGPELAAVLVEPVQSRRPDLQPTTFLKELREFTSAHDIALIFDEVITGFRVHPGGAQAWFDIAADIVTYGKVLGAGMPMGAIAGRRRYLDTVDGGAWSYGDDSHPLAPTTFFGGTFNKNPLAMAAAESVLLHIKEQGPNLQRELNERVASLADEFNEYCRHEEFPVSVVYFSSLFRFICNGEYSLQRFPLEMDLFFYLMALKGVYILETRICFLSTSHTSDDVEFIVSTAKECLQALRNGGFFPRAEGQLRTSVNLSADAYLDPTIMPAGHNSLRPYENVLLTGATGFLGAHLLNELLRTSSVRIYCLVRARNEREASERVRRSLSAYGCWDDAFASRIVAVPGDLSQSSLGLTESWWRQLADQVDAIYHCGAMVDSVLPYHKLKPANVDGTRELLRLAVSQKTKDFHYISSDAVFDAYGYLRKTTIYENEPLAYSDSIYGGGYAESKWVAEKLVAIARERGVPAFIYRPGMVTGNSSEEICRLDDFFALFIKGIIQLQIYPELDAIIDFAPVDYVSKTIVQLSHQSGSGETFHLTHWNPITYSEFIDAIRGAGFVLRAVSYREWQDTLVKLRYENDNALYPLVPALTESMAPIFRKAKLDVTNARRGARSLSQSCPALAHLMSLYMARFVAQGFIKSPDTVARHADP